VPLERLEFIGLAFEPAPNLAHAEKLQMVDQRAADGGEEPAEDEDEPDGDTGKGAVDRPDRHRNRLPGEDQESEGEIGAVDIGGALKRLRQQAGAHPLHRATRHAGALEAEQRDQGKIDDDRRADTHVRHAIDARIGNPVEEKQDERREDDMRDDKADGRISKAAGPPKRATAVRRCPQSPSPPRISTVVFSGNRATRSLKAQSGGR
jgi:hypothetical protein